MNAPVSFMPVKHAIASLRQKPSTGRGFGTLWLDDIQGLDPEPEWLLKGVLPMEGLSALWGDPGSGKSFLALDMAMAVAQGVSWFDRRAVKGGVVYLAAEGGRGIKKRLLVYRQRFAPASGLPFALIPSSVDLCTEDHETEALIGELADIAAAMAEPLRLVVIDTLSRVMAGGNENQPEDMGALIRNADSIRQRTGAHVMFVHHSGKDRDRKTRGHSSLYGALDAAIEVTHTKASGLRIAEIAKQKDGEAGLTFAFKLEAVELGMADGCPVSSCVVRPDEAPEAEPQDERWKPTGAAAIALRALERVIADAGTVPPACVHIPSGVKTVSADLWRRWFYQLRPDDKAEAKRQAFGRALDTLQAKGFIGVWGDKIWLT